ncbi:SLC13 family permease [Yoonia sp.]|uniref:SLC13 family permease n=1 Tax=Yoonia sp. TaxID=2212373 RepID=UPI0025ECAFF3|nr:SLC13 family permease [Yoonia sp.]
MTLEIAIVLGLLVAAMVLFVTEWVSVDAVALGLVAALIATGTLSPAQAYSGFGGEIIVILACIMVLAGAIVKAGVMDKVGQLAFRAGQGKPQLSFLALLSVSAVSSAFISNTNTTAILMPAAVETARHAKTSASRMLMPLAFASMLGGSSTLIGTSTNLAGSGMVAQLGLEPFSLFEFAAVGAIITVVGLFWLVWPGQYLMRDRRAVAAQDQSSARRYFTTLCLPEGSRVVDKQIGDLDFDAFETDLLSVVRDGEMLSVHHSRKLRAGDELMIRASREGILMLSRSSDYMFEHDLHFTARYAQDVEMQRVEAVITPRSRFVGQSLKQIAFFDRFRGIVLAVYQPHRSRSVRIENLKLRAGDVLLLKGPKYEMTSLNQDAGLQVLTQIDQTVLTRRQGKITIVAMLAAIAVSIMGFAPFSLTVLLAVLAVVLADVLSLSEAYRFIEWRLLVLIGGMSSFGLAMEQSGTAAYLAEHIVTLSEPIGPYFAMGCFCLLAVLLTQPMSNAAAALTVIPVAVAAADGLGLEPRMLAVLVTLSASLSFISPLEPACLLVYDPGRYTFFDYVRAGTPLTLISVAILLFLVPLIWG